MWCVIIYVVFELYRVHFSFTKIFADNIWVFLMIYKILGILIEIKFLYRLNDEL